MRGNTIMMYLQLGHTVMDHQFVNGVPQGLDQMTISLDPGWGRDQFCN
jgi:hypothetical protein